MHRCTDQNDGADASVVGEGRPRRSWQLVTVPHCELAVVRRLALMLSAARSDDRLEWLKVGWCLRNVAADADEGGVVSAHCDRDAALEKCLPVRSSRT